MTTINKYSSTEGKCIYLQCLEKSGQIIRFKVPAFTGPIVKINGAYTDAEWSKHGSDKSNYNWQIKEATKLFAKKIESGKLKLKISESELQNMKEGICPKRYVIHHLSPAGKNLEDCILQLVDRQEHAERKHIGASYIANSKKRKELLEKNKDWEISRTDKIKNQIFHLSHKHPIETSTIIGCSVATITYIISKKIEKRYRMGLSLVMGITTGILSNYFLNCGNKTYYL